MAGYRRIADADDLVAVHAAADGFVMDPFNHRIHRAGCARVATLGRGQPKWHAQDDAALREYEAWRASFAGAKPLRPCEECRPAPGAPPRGLRAVRPVVPAVSRPPTAFAGGVIADPLGRFVLRPPAGPDDVVEFWMTSRLSYDNRPDWQVELLSKLRPALASLDWAAGHTLSGVFATSDPARCDAENLLFYNPGASAFSDAPPRLMFERVDAVPAPPPELVPTPTGPYYHAYRGLPLEADFQFWRSVGEPLASFADVPIGSITGDQAGRLVWWWMRQAEERTFVERSVYPYDKRFSLRLVVGVPSGGAVKLAGVVKGLFDGVIGSLHRGMNDADMRRGARMLWPKLAAVVPSEEELVLALLTERTRLLPGPAFKVHRTWVQLDPADHRCVAGCVELRENATARGRVLSGDLFRVTPQAS